MLLGYIVLQLFCIYNFCYMQCYFTVKYTVYFHITTFHSMCAVPNMAVFCSSLISYFPGRLLRYCLSNFEMVPVATIITSITFTWTFHMH